MRDCSLQPHLAEKLAACLLPDVFDFLGWEAEPLLPEAQFLLLLIYTAQLDLDNLMLAAHLAFAMKWLAWEKRQGAGILHMTTLLYALLPA